MEDAAEQLDRLAQRVGECTLCPELAARRLRAVPGSGDPHCNVMIISLQPDPLDEAEDKPAGSTVVESMTAFMPALRDAGDRVYITTLLKCVARDDHGARAPGVEELDACFPFVSREISITTPHYILSVGELTSRYLLRRLFEDQPYREGDSLELRIFDNPAFRVVPIAEPSELHRRDTREQKEYAERLRALAQIMGL